MDERPDDHPDAPECDADDPSTVTAATNDIAAIIARLAARSESKARPASSDGRSLPFARSSISDPIMYDGARMARSRLSARRARGRHYPHRCVSIMLSVAT